MFRHGTRSAKSSPALPLSLGAHKPQHTTWSSTSQLLPNTGSKKNSTEHNFLCTKLEQTSSFGSTLNWLQVEPTQPCPDPQLNPDKSPRTGFSFCGCSYVILVHFWSCAKDMKVNSISRGFFSQCNLLIFCPFWLYKTQGTHFSIKQYMPYPDWIWSVCLKFQIAYSSSNSVTL